MTTSLRAARTAALFLLAALPAMAADRTVTVDINAQRQSEISIYSPDFPQGVMIFSHGYGASPDGYIDMLETFKSDGWLVIAPTHIDSLSHPLHDKVEQAETFTARMADLRAAAKLAHEMVPDAPLVMAGHSYGSLFALMSVGSQTLAGDLTDLDTVAALAWSSPGVIQGLTSPEQMGEASKPFMIITGDKDVVTGFVPDPAAHRAAFDNSEGEDAYLIVAEGGTHNIAHDPDDPAYDFALAEAREFLAAYGMNDAEAEADLSACGAHEGFEISCR